MIDYIDIEEFAKQGKIVPSAKKYILKVDRKKYKVESEFLTGREILELANKVPYNRFQLNQKIHGGQVTKIGYDEKVDLTAPGVERFMTLPLDQTEG